MSLIYLTGQVAIHLRSSLLLCWLIVRFVTENGPGRGDKIIPDLGEELRLYKWENSSKCLHWSHEGFRGKVDCLGCFSGEYSQRLAQEEGCWCHYSPDEIAALLSSDGFLSDEVQT